MGDAKLVPHSIRVMEKQLEQVPSRLHAQEDSQRNLRDSSLRLVIVISYLKI